MKGISAKELDRLEREELDPVLVDRLGFSFARGSYHRTLSNGLIQLVMTQLHKDKATFRVILGLDSTVLSGPADSTRLGAYFAEYLDPAGVTKDPHRWPASSEQTARTSWKQIHALIEPALMPWLQRYSTPTAFADVLTDDHDFLKGKLLLADGQEARAREYLKRYRTRLAAMVASPQVTATLREVDGLLRDDS